MPSVPSSATGLAKLDIERLDLVEPDLGRLWSLTGVEAPSVHDWGDAVAVYNPISGNTHLLDQVSGELLDAITKEPQSVLELCQHVADFLDISNDDTVATRVAQLLEQLDELALIEPAAR